MIGGNKRPLILKDNVVARKTKIPYMTLKQLFANNIVELKFQRRTPLPKGKSTTGHMHESRRMLCTSNWRLISSPLTRWIYKWKKPKSRRNKNWYFQRRLIIVWDLMQMSFRMVSLDDYIIIGYMPVSNILDKAKFTNYYMQNIYRLPKDLKNKFSDK